MAELAYVGLDHHVYATQLGGGSGRCLSAEIAGLRGGPEWVFRWPTYSPDGRRIAFAGYREIGGGVAESALIVAELESGASRVLRSATGEVPIYLYWCPDSLRLTALVQQQTSLALILLAQDAPPVRLAAGRAVYWSWAPDATRIALHVNGNAAQNRQAWVGLVHLDGTAWREERFLDRPAGFRAPAFSPDGSLLAFAAWSEDGPGLMLRGSDGRTNRLLEMGTEAAFTWSPDARAASLVVSSAVPPSAHAYNGLELVRAADGARRRLTEGDVAAFFWAPKGALLAYIGAELPGKARYWATLDTSSGPVGQAHMIVPTRDLAFALPFFDQYAQSLTFWSADGGRLVTASAPLAERGNGSSTAEKILVLEPGRPERAETVAAGSFAVWAPVERT